MTIDVQNDGNNPQDGQQIIINQIASEQQSNGIGVAGFVLSLIALFLIWVPVLGLILWGLGLVFSLIGMFKTPRGLAIAGSFISVIGFIGLMCMLVRAVRGLNAVIDFLGCLLTLNTNCNY